MSTDYERLVAETEAGDVRAAMRLVREAERRADWMRVKQAADLLVGDVVWAVTIPTVTPLSRSEGRAIARHFVEECATGAVVVPQDVTVRLLPQPKACEVNDDQRP
jgi:hypothetical protein